MIAASIQDSRSAVFAELVRFGLELESEGVAQTGDGFTGRREADAFLKSDPNAFLIGVLFTQGIPAERAWAGPWELRCRLGHFDLSLMANDSEAVREAVQRPPMLHRFKNTLPEWISRAAKRLLAEWDGDAAKIWSPGSHVVDVTERLFAFEGIGRKKAAMAVQILMRHFHVALAGRDFGRVAYDIHTRRVFLRTGLIDVDSIEALEAAAIEGYAPSPGTLDLAVWLIGRQVCRPILPKCEECRLGQICPRMIWLTPKGVGSRGIQNSLDRSEHETGG